MIMALLEMVASAKRDERTRRSLPLILTSTVHAVRPVGHDIFVCRNMPENREATEKGQELEQMMMAMDNER